jgi:hypothetical protein
MDPVGFPIAQASPTSPYASGLGVGARADQRVFETLAADPAKGQPHWQVIAGYNGQVTGAALLGDALYTRLPKAVPTAA